MELFWKGLLPSIAEVKSIFYYLHLQVNSSVDGGGEGRKSHGKPLAWMEIALSLRYPSSLTLAAVCSFFSYKKHLYKTGQVEIK